MFPYEIDDKPKEECGIFGLFAPGLDVARTTYFSLYALQHRGQEGAGIVTSDGQVAHIHKGTGLVAQVFNEENLSHLKGHMAVGHTRYSTTGSSVMRNAQPYLIETLHGPLAVAHNGNLTNAPSLRNNLLQRGIGLSSSSDTEIIVHLLSGAGGDWMSRIRTFMAQAEGAYSLILLTRDGIFGVRDPWGFRPLVLGKIDEGYVLASESCAFSTSGAEIVREIMPGEIVRLDEEGYSVVQGAHPQARAFCTFEHIYFARPDSVLDGKSVHHVRQALGRQLAREAPADADIVVPVPDSGTPHAIGYAQESGLPYTEGLIKNRYIGRTFIQPTDRLRRASVAMKFNPLAENLVGQRVIIVDDSIERLPNCPATKRFSEGEHFVEQHSHAEDVRPLVDVRLTEDLLGRHIQWRARSLSHDRQRLQWHFSLFELFVGREIGRVLQIIVLSPHFGHSPIEQNHLSKTSHPDVLGFDVAVDHPMIVGVCQCEARTADDVEERHQWIMSFRFVIIPRQPFHDLEQILTGDPFHRKVQITILIPPDIVDRDRVRML